MNIHPAHPVSYAVHPTHPASHAVHPTHPVLLRDTINLVKGEKMFVPARWGDDMIDWMNIQPIHPAVVWGRIYVHPTLTHSIGGGMSRMNTSHLSCTKMEI